MNKIMVSLLVVIIILAIIFSIVFFTRNNGEKVAGQTSVIGTPSITTTTNHIVSSSSSAPALSMTNSYAINLPNALLIVDSQGRRTGKDPIAGISYHEIPDTSYSEEGNSGQLYFFAPPAGHYTLYVLGGQSGQYHLDAWVDDGGSKPPVPQRISGDIQKGSAVVYSQNYDPSNIPSSSVSFQNNISSAASITSAPPQNLPPPPVP
jgi:hypothetical protein